MKTQDEGKTDSGKITHRDVVQLAVGYGIFHHVRLLRGPCEEVHRDTTRQASKKATATCSVRHPGGKKGKTSLTSISIRV